MPNTANSKNIKKNNQIEDNLQQQTLKRFLWLKQNFAYCLLVSALMWGVAVCYYIDKFIGWGSIVTLSPVDFTSFVLSVVGPLLFLWLILAYIERTNSIDTNTQMLQSYINSLMYPDEDASRNAQAISVALQEQVKFLHKESKNVITQSQQLKADLEARITDLSDVLKLLDNYSAKTLLEINDNIKELANRCSYITDKTSTSAQQLKHCSDDIAQNSDKFLSKVSPLVNEISALSSNIKNNISDNKNNLIYIKDQLTTCADLSQQYVRDMLLKTDENVQRIEQSFYRAAEEYDNLYKRLDTSISSIEGRVEEQKRLVQSQTQVINHNSELLDNKLSKYGQSVSQEIDKLVKNSIELEKISKRQIATLKAVNHETGAAVRGIGDVFDEKRMEIERRTEYAINSMQNVVIAINKETEKLLSFTNLTQAKNYDLQNIAETIVDKIGDISSKLALKTDTLKDKAVEVIERFTEAGELINRSTDKINTSSNLILNNSRQSVKLLEEQNFYINNALSNIDSVKDKLDKLHIKVTQTSSGITQQMTDYEKQLNSTVLQQKKIQTIEPEEPKIDKEQLIKSAKTINRILRNNNINAEKLFEKQDIFGLWESYLSGKQTSFTDVLFRNLTHKQSLAIRKAFDDNADFHNQVIRYLFLMDMTIKEMATNDTTRDELINFSVNQSLDKLYFILVRALNSAE